jgi:hypothetical protein
MAAEFAAEIAAFEQSGERAATGAIEPERGIAERAVLEYAHDQARGDGVFGGLLGEGEV